MIAILRAFDLLPGWVWALITAGALAAAGVSQTRFTHERANHAETRAQYADQVAQASEQARKKEKELQDVVEQAQKEADAIRADRDAIAARAAAASARLRAANGATSACQSASTAAERKAADEAANLRADMLGRLDEISGQVSRFADDAHQAGLTCQRIYEAAR